MPTLRLGDIVIMANLPAHKADGIRQAIERQASRCPICRPTAPLSGAQRVLFPNRRGGGLAQLAQQHEQRVQFVLRKILQHVLAQFADL